VFSFQSCFWTSANAGFDLCVKPYSRASTGEKCKTSKQLLMSGRVHSLDLPDSVLQATLPEMFIKSPRRSQFAESSPRKTQGWEQGHYFFFSDFALPFGAPHLNVVTNIASAQAQGWLPLSAAVDTMTPFHLRKSRDRSPAPGPTMSPLNQGRPSRLGVLNPNLLDSRSIRNGSPSNSS